MIPYTTWKDILKIRVRDYNIKQRAIRFWKMWWNQLIYETKLHNSNNPFSRLVFQMYGLYLYTLRKYILQFLIKNKKNLVIVMYSTKWNIHPIAKSTEDYTHWIKKTEKDHQKRNKRTKKEFLKKNVKDVNRRKSENQLYMNV